jgi:hypothetical protein
LRPAAIMGNAERNPFAGTILGSCIGGTCHTPLTASGSSPAARF